MTWENYQPVNWNEWTICSSYAVIELRHAPKPRFLRVSLSCFFSAICDWYNAKSSERELIRNGPGSESELDSIGWHWKVVDLLRWHRICRTKLRDSSQSRRYLTRFDHLLGFEDDPSIFDGFVLTKLGRNSSTLSLWFMNLRRLNCQKVHQSTKFLPFGDWEAIAAGNQKGFGHLWPGFV